MTSIGEIISQNPELFVTNENEEQDQTDQRSDEKQQPEEKSLRSADTVDPTGIRVGERNSTSRQHDFQAVFEIFILLLRVASNVLPHDVNDGGSNQRVFNDKWIQVWS